MSLRPIVPAIAIVAVLGLGACSSASSQDTTAPAPASASAVEGELGTAEMRALCDEMVSGALTAEDATSLAEQNGYTARVGSIDGEGQALTMDLREDRFTFEVEGGVVIGCTYG
jgi:hypothetical protein